MIVYYKRESGNNMKKKDNFKTLSLNLGKNAVHTDKQELC